MLFARKSDVEVSLNKHIRELPMVPPAILSPTPPPQRMSWRQQHRARAGGRQLCIQQRGGGDREGIMMVIVSSCVAATQARGNPQPIRGPGCPPMYFQDLCSNPALLIINSSTEGGRRRFARKAKKRGFRWDTLILESPASSSCDVCRECAPAVRREGKVLSSAPCKMLPPEALRWPERHCK